MLKKPYVYIISSLLLILLIYIFKPIEINKVFNCNVYNMNPDKIFQLQLENITIDFEGSLKKQLGLGFTKSTINGKICIDDVEYSFNLFKSGNINQEFYTGILKPVDSKIHEYGWKPLIRISSDFNNIFIEYMTNIDSNELYKIISGTSKN